MSLVKRLAQEAIDRRALVACAHIAADDAAATGCGSREEFMDAMADVFVAVAFDIYALAAAARGEPVSVDRIAESLTLALEVSKAKGRTMQ